MALLTNIETAIVERVKSHFGKTLLTCESYTGAITDRLLGKCLSASPAVLVGFIDAPVESRQLITQWGVYAIVSNAGGQKAQRHGDSKTLGGYALAEMLIQLLEGHKIQGIGSLSLKKMTNMIGAQSLSDGLTVYGLTFSLKASLPNEADLDSLDDFETFDAQYDLAPSDGESDAHDTVTLETLT